MTFSPKINSENYSLHFGFTKDCGGCSRLGIKLPLRSLQRSARSALIPELLVVARQARTNQKIQASLTITSYYVFPAVAEIEILNGGGKRTEFSESVAPSV